MWMWKKKTVTPPQTSTPTQDLNALGPVARQNHIAYVPSGSWSGVPGVGTGNLVYAPDFLLSAVEDGMRGNGMSRKPNSIMICQVPVLVNAPKQVLEGVGGLVAGQVVHQPLLEVNINNENTTSD